jgi:hypothetical protein
MQTRQSRTSQVLDGNDDRNDDKDGHDPDSGADASKYHRLLIEHFVKPPLIVRDNQNPFNW